MKIEIDEQLCCKDSNGREWVLVPKQLSKKSEAVLKQYKGSPAISPHAAYKYLVADKPPFKYGDKVIKPMDKLAVGILSFITSIILLALIINVGATHEAHFKYYAGKLVSYLASLPISWVITNVVLLMTVVVILLFNKRRK